MARLAFDSQNCQGVTLGNGRRYDSDRSGLIHVENPTDIKALKAGGYTVVGAVARGKRYWVCDTCDRDCNINHCSKCDSSDLRKVVE
jgi:hypothetical protein